MYERKYYNIKTRSSDGIVHDSGKEAHRWEQLLLMKKAGEIYNLRRQVRFELLPAQYHTVERFSKTGQRLKEQKLLLERKVEYVADFVYTDTKTGETIVEDTEGVKTKDYIIKRKLMLAVCGIRVREV